MIPWLLSGGLGIAAALLVLLYRSRLERARDQVELWRSQAGSLTAELHHEAASFLEERKRLEGTIRVLRDDLAAAHRRMADLADRDPAGYVRGVLTDLAGSAPDPGAHPPLPRPTAAAPVGGSGPRRGG
jgi:hypothetical protein